MEESGSSQLHFRYGYQEGEVEVEVEVEEILGTEFGANVSPTSCSRRRGIKVDVDLSSIRACGKPKCNEVIRNPRGFLEIQYKLFVLTFMPAQWLSVDVLGSLILLLVVVSTESVIFLHGVVTLSLSSSVAVFDVAVYAFRESFVVGSSVGIVVCCETTGGRTKSKRVLRVSTNEMSLRSFKAFE